MEVAPDVRTAIALERIVELIEETRAEAEAAKEPPPDLTKVKLDLTVTEGKHVCPYCAAHPTTLLMRGRTVFGCSHCVPSFVLSLGPSAKFIDDKINEGWVAGVMHAEAIVRLAGEEFDRAQIADTLQKEIATHDRKGKGRVHAAAQAR